MTRQITPIQPPAGSVKPNAIALADTHVLVGNSSGQAADVAMSGDATIADTGAVSVTKSGGIVFASAALQTAEGTVVAAATTDLSTSIASRQSVTGNTTITGFGAGVNLIRTIRFVGKPLLTYNATSLITPTGRNIQAAPGDVAVLSSDASGNWRITAFTPAGGPVKASATGVSVALTGTAIASVTLGPGTWLIAAFVAYNGSQVTNTAGVLALSTTQNTGTGTDGISQARYATFAAGGVGGGTIPAFEVTLTADSTVYYLNGTLNTISDTCNGSIYAQRVI